MKKTSLTIIFALLICLCASEPLSARQRPSARPELSNITIIDRNGFSETISVSDKLKRFEKVDFLQNCPYEKVVRVFKRDQKGDCRSLITSYHANGQVNQYLEAVNGRAQGKYREWHQNGKIKLAAQVIGGTADISEGSEISWLFDGLSQAWDEEGNLLAEIPYSKGQLEGMANYFHPNKAVWKKIPYHKNFPDGCTEIFLSDGKLLQKTHFSQGILHGESLRYWMPDVLASREFFKEGKLASGQYYDIHGGKMAEIEGGTGTRAVFSKDYIMEYHEYRDGELHGKVRVYSKEGQLIRDYHVKKGKRDGVETFYFETISPGQPKLALEWRENKIQGSVKTWYPNGTQESQREFSRNQKNGLAMAWYQDGNIMLIEEYKNDKLVKGEYFAKGEKKSVSKITKGNGVAHIYDAEGNFIHEIVYSKGKPMPEEPSKSMPLTTFREP